MIIKVRQPKNNDAPKTDYGYKHPLDDYQIGTVVNWVSDDAGNKPPPSMPDGWERYDPTKHHKF